VEQQPTFDVAWKRRATAGEMDAIGEMVDASLEPLFRFCLYRVGKNRHLCEEVVQETIVRGIADLRNYQPERSGNCVFPWLSGLARNEIRRALACEPAASNLETIWERMDEELRAIFGRLESEPLATEVLAREETREMVNATMAQLPQRYRLALEAKYVSRRSVKDIAKDQATSEKAIESLLTRARQAFRETFLALTRNLASEGGVM
jgi:RNA polymerase sigma-70 factor (ECF subfamily)